MGLLDSVISAIGTKGGASSQQAALLPALLDLIKQFPGGVPGLIARFKEGGLGAVVASWIGSGANLPISGDQLQSVLGSAAIGNLAERSGLGVQDVLSTLSTMLPSLVDQATPNGEADIDKLNDLSAGSLLGTLGSLFGGKAG